MSPPFWIHCNICNALLNKDLKHFLLSCNHIICKTCMKDTNEQKCLLCKCEVRFEDMTKLSDKRKVNFHPDVKNLFVEPAKVLQFQRNHTRNITKLTHNYKTKSKQMIQMFEKEKQEVMKLKAQLDSCIKQRRMMQEKLKEIYMRNQMKRKDELYRNPANSTISTDLSSGKVESPIDNSVSVPQITKSGFFNEDSQLGKRFSAFTNDFFKERHSSVNKQSKNIEHTQSDRTPFFA